MSEPTAEAKLIQAIDVLSSRFDQVQTVRKFIEQRERAERERVISAIREWQKRTMADITSTPDLSEFLDELSGGGL